MSAEQSYRDSIFPSREAYISDREILERLAGRGDASPWQLAERRRRENVIRLQCRDLTRAGLISEVSHEQYQITDAGVELLPGNEPKMDTSGMIDLDQFLAVDHIEDSWNLSDFSLLDPETIKEINRGEFKSGAQYGLVKEDSNLTERELTERRISNVPASRINRLIEEFPTNEPLPQQCAHWMRAFTGIHFFPDANHRTGMNTLQILVDHNCDTELSITDDIGWYILQSKLIRHLQSDIRFNTLWKRDEHYTLWHRYFRQVLCGSDEWYKSPHSREDLRDVLRYARERKQLK